MTGLQQINNYNTYNTIIIQNHKNYEIFTLFGMEGLFILPFHLWTHSCHHHTLSYGAYSWMWDCHIFSIYTGPKGASSSVLHNC